MTLKQAVKKLGGPSAVAYATGIPRTTLVHWLKIKTPPAWRKRDVEYIIHCAEIA